MLHASAIKRKGTKMQMAFFSLSPFHLISY